MQISKNETFKKEYKQITEFLNQCDNEAKKKEVTNLLKELVRSVEKIDRIHLDMFSTGKALDDPADVRNKMLELRRKIFKIIGYSR